jgi:uncharacterized protein YneF (UPF0154 family)
MAMDWVMILVVIVTALVGGVVGGELASRRNRAAMVQASGRLHDATSQVRAVRQELGRR